VNSGLKRVLRELSPPVLWRLAHASKAAARRFRSSGNVQQKGGDGTHQELDIYWDPKMAELLETWGEGNAWNEIRMLLLAREGKVLDIACGTGKVMTIVQSNPGLEVHGCDISDFLISKAIQRGLPAANLRVCDATNMPYDKGFFDFGYSIGSLEHFTEDGIDRVFHGCNRVVSGMSFHMIPVSRSDKNEGWITPQQAYFNNSVTWWTDKARRAFREVEVLDSVWCDERSVGKWLVCFSGN
jgi:SAM-dependent methyltransferase